MNNKFSQIRAQRVDVQKVLGNERTRANNSKHVQSKKNEEMLCNPRVRRINERIFFFLSFFFFGLYEVIVRQKNYKKIHRLQKCVPNVWS